MRPQQPIHRAGVLDSGVLGAALLSDPLCYVSPPPQALDGRAVRAVTRPPPAYR